MGNSQKECSVLSVTPSSVFTTERVSPITFIDASNFVFMIITNAVTGQLEYRRLAIKVYGSDRVSHNQCFIGYDIIIIILSEMNKITHR